MNYFPQQTCFIDVFLFKMAVCIFPDLNGKKYLKILQCGIPLHVTSAVCVRCMDRFCHGIHVIIFMNISQMHIERVRVCMSHPLAVWGDLYQQYLDYQMMSFAVCVLWRHTVYNGRHRTGNDRPTTALCSSFFHKFCMSTTPRSTHSVIVIFMMLVNTIPFTRLEF